jgi:positive regulator of sigma E activity
MVSSSQIYVLSDSSDKNSNNYHFSKSAYYTASTIVAMVMAIPGIIALLLVRTYTTDVASQVIISSIVFFMGMGFSFKIAKKIANKMDKNKASEPS